MATSQTYLDSTTTLEDTTNLTSLMCWTTQASALKWTGKEPEPSLSNNMDSAEDIDQKVF